jgi:hypothetical protein
MLQAGNECLKKTVSSGEKNCKASFYAEEGHLTLPYNRMGGMLTALVA